MQSDVLIQALLHDEGLRLKPYRDTVGKLTIGCGRNIDDNGIRKAEAMLMLELDIQECERDLRESFPWFGELDEVRQHVLLNMRFQLGPSRFRSFKTMLAAVARKDYAAAADAMRFSKWADQVPNRANRLIEEMRSGVVA